MDNDAENVGIGFCRLEGSDRIRISPGLAFFLKGSTGKTCIELNTLNTMPQKMVGDQAYRLLRSQNKVVALFEWGHETSFARVCSVLSRLGREDHDGIPRKISVDAAVVGYGKGEVADRYRYLKASKKHEIIVCEAGRVDLCYLKITGSTTFYQRG